MKILFLGYDDNRTNLIRILRRISEVVHTDGKLTLLNYDSFDLGVSFGYRWVVPKHVLESLEFPIVNLHLSYLPYNRGFHPNFWAHYDGTPHGVTLHLLDGGIDTGDILFRKRVVFTPEENTFDGTYLRLIREAENLFVKNIDTVLSKSWRAVPQEEGGTYHSESSLPPGVELLGDIDSTIKMVKADRSQHNG